MSKNNRTLDILFKDIRVNGKYYVQSRNGNEFEQKFKNKLKSYGFSEIVHRVKTNSVISDISNLEEVSLNAAKFEWKKIKNSIIKKNSIEIITNPFYKIKNTFIFQPFGSQEFPDFIVFLDKYICPIEIKYSKNERYQKNLNNFRPMWNSNMPKPNAIYLYGVASEEVTFFKGDDILDFDTRQVLLDFFNKLDRGFKNLNDDLKNLKNNFGIYPYIRKAYDHKKEHSTYIDIKNKRIIESYFSKNREIREKNVINFLKELEK